jgi:hypothetical protein
VRRANFARSVSRDLNISLTADWTQANDNDARAAGFQVDDADATHPAMVDTFIPLIDHLWDASGTYAGNPNPPPYGRMGDYAPWLSRGPHTANARTVMDYQTCDSTGCDGATLKSGWPNYTIDAQATQNRAEPWLSFELGTGGEFYYSMAAAYNPGTQSLGDPWSAPLVLGKYGEGTLFYPGIPDVTGRTWPPQCASGGFAPHTPSIGGTHDVPVPTIRLKLIREGMEDYEYLTTYKAGGGDALHKALAVYANAYTTDVDPTLLLRTRDDIAAGIERQRTSFQIIFVTDPRSGNKIPIVISL